MAVVSVTFQGTRVNASDANTDWNKVNVGGGAPAAEPANRYQGTNIVGNQIKTSIGGLEYDPGAGAVDMTAANRQLWFVKCVITDYADLVTTIGAEIRVGSSSGDYYDYVVSGTNSNRSRFNAWPSQGGFLIFGLNPEITSWRESTTGTPDLTAVDYFAFLVDTQNGLSKSENMGLDAIDIGTGLLVTGGTGADPRITYQDLVDEDQGVSGNRWGVVTQPQGAGSPITCNGLLEFGTASTAAWLDDDAATVIYPDGYHGAGDVGIAIDLTQFGTIIVDDSSHLGLGSSTTEDTRPDLVVTGTNGQAFLTGNYQNFRNITLNNRVTFSGSFSKCELLTQGGASWSIAVCTTLSASGVATLQDPTFGTTTGLRDTSFVQGNAGHAIELDTATSYTLSNISFFDYGADATNSAAIFVSATSGTCTINIINGGDTPTVRTAGATVVVQNTVTVSVTVIDAVTKSAISGARVLLEADTGGPLSAGTDILDGTTNGSGVIETTAFNYSSDQPVVGRVRNASGAGPYYKTSDITGTITSTGFSTTILLISDE